jgi:hypothetical protein
MPPHAIKPKSATNKQLDMTLYPLLNNDLKSRCGNLVADPKIGKFFIKVNKISTS